uniref:Uncharacterized protein n=1 Tax=Aegilops tauschii subsp. strangulata TaxID=200361 RepID=A0A453QPA4_AEGTS
MEVVSTIAKVVQEIVKAAGTARENRERCLDLAGRACTVGEILLLDSSTASTSSSTSGYTARLRKPSLERLKAVLEDARCAHLTESCGGLNAPRKSHAGRASVAHD